MRGRKATSSVGEALSNGSFPHDNAAITRHVTIYIYRVIVVHAWKCYELGEYGLMMATTRRVFGTPDRIAAEEVEPEQPQLAGSAN